MKTPEEKAKELVDKFLFFTKTECMCYADDVSEQDFIDAKECALIAAKELVCQLELIPYTFGGMGGHKEYWREVVQEIEKL